MAQQPKEERVVEIIVNGTKANASLKEMAAAAAVLSNQVAKIAADDPKRAELIGQLQQMRQRITATRAEVNGLVQSQEQLAAAQAATVAEQARAIAAGQASTASLTEMKTAAGLLERQLHDLAADDPGRAALIADFQALKARMDEARAAITTVVKTEAELRAEEQALTQALAERVAAEQHAIAAGKQQSASLLEMSTAAGLLEKQLQAMSADDPGRAALLADFQALRTRLQAAREEMTRVVKTEAELRAEQEALRASQQQLVVNGQRVSASMREMREAAAQLEGELDELGQNDPARGPLIAALQTLRTRIRAVGDEVNGVTETTSRMRQVMTVAFGSILGDGIEGVIDKVVETGKSIFTTTAKFETYGKVLENALGSKSLAQKALADIQKMAASTPFSVDELTESFVKFVNRGLSPSMAELENLGDLASSQGKSFDQLTEAVLDAGTGEFERLKEFGISASKSGDQVALSFKGVTQTVANTPAAINAAIVAFGDAKGVMGGMAAISTTLDGQLSNLGDTADQTAVEWGQTLRPVFVAVLATLGFLLGALKALPSFIKDNRAAFIGLGAALVTLNAEQIILNGLVLAQVAIEKGRALALRATAAAQWLLNAAMGANPIGAVALAVGLLVAGLITLYEKSEGVRNVIAGMSAAFASLGQTIKNAILQSITGIGDTKALFWNAGKNAAQAYHDGYEAEARRRDSEANKGYEETRKLLLERIKNYLDKRAKLEADTAKKNRLEALKNEEAELKERLAKAEKDSELEMRLKQKLVTNAAAQELEDVKKTAAERRIILAEAEGKRVELARDFFEKQAKERAAAALKHRLADIEAEKHHADMLAQVRQAAIVARGDERVAELSAIYTDGQLKINALKATAAKEIAQLTGSGKEKAARARDIEQALAAEVALVQDAVQQKQQEKQAKYLEDDQKLRKEFAGRQLEAIDEYATRQEAAFEVMLSAGLLSQQQADEARYQARKAALERELALVGESLGKESAEYKKVQAAMLKNEVDYNKKSVADRDKAAKQKIALERMGMQVAGDVLSFGLDLLGQDAEARKKHHSLYTALAAAKVIVDGTKEVARIWEYSADNPANGPTMGAAGIILGGIQTGVAIARTAVALGQLRGAGGGGGDNASYAKGGATGTGAGLAVSPMGMLMQLSGMSVGGDGKLNDGSGFAVAGVVHEDEYVIPKWQLQDPQVAAVAQWLEARRRRGFADGGHTSASSGATLPVAAASPATDGEKLYAVQAQVLDQLVVLTQQLGDVKQWQRELQVRLDLRAAQARTDEYKQVQYNSAIRSKAGPAN